MYICIFESMYICIFESIYIIYIKIMIRIATFKTWHYEIR